MTAAELARTHAAAFPGAGWSETDFSAYLTDPNVTIFGTARAFAVIRVLGPEAEILTLATDPADQGKGHATSLLATTLDQLAQRAVQEVFLEVATDNTAARALYARAGFTPFGTRPNYYANGADAICLKRVLPA